MLRIIFASQKYLGFLYAATKFDLGNIILLTVYGFLSPDRLSVLSLGLFFFFFSSSSVHRSACLQYCRWVVASAGTHLCIAHTLVQMAAETLPGPIDIDIK